MNIMDITISMGLNIHYFYELNSKPGNSATILKTHQRCMIEDILKNIG
jgi:hypothetical protein